MRLKSIKLAGFKSFVDPTTVAFPSNLCAIVGPNGCGKSNIIDAVRWVMGESSAKHLRGESMTDVIFNGSGGRKPVGQASIELIFDNSDGTIVGEYASFAEISVKRKVTRDAQNTYFLNGSKCRRRDITDLFLGTGLGPRSYAIIEQGMISNLIEAKPDELRTTIEEAAGISKYKERRRDTENRIHRTLENLERLTDIREELERQLGRLERQSKAAEKYSELKKEERWLKAQELALRIRALDQKAQTNKTRITELELKIESLVTDRVSRNTGIEKLRTQHTELNDKFNEVQGRYYAAGSDIARVEQSIHHAEERSQQLRIDLDNSQRELREAEENLLSDRQKSEDWQAELLELEPELEAVKDTESVSTEELLAAESAMQGWQSEWDTFNQRAAKPQQDAEVQQSRIQHIEQVQVRLLERVEKLRNEQAELADNNDDENIAELQEDIAALELIVAGKREELDGLNERIETIRERSQQNQDQLNRERSELQQMRGRHASLEALQQAAMAETSKDVSRWLEQQGVAGNPRLAERIQVQDGWDTAVETVLGESLQAVCIDGLDPLAGVLGELQQGSLVLLDAQASPAAAPHDKGPRLLDKITCPQNLEDLLSGVYLAEDLNGALQLRERLQAGESVVTREGIWLGASWLRVAKGKDATAGILERQQELEVLEERIARAEDTIAGLEGESENLREELKSVEAQQSQLRQTIEAENRKISEQQSALSAKKVRIEESHNRHQRAAAEIREADEQMKLEGEHLAEARHLLAEAIEAMEENNVERERLMSQRDQFRETLDKARQKARHDKDRAHELAMRFQSVQTQLQSTRQGIERLEQQSQRLLERREMLQTSIEELIEPLEANKLELAELLERRLAVESELTEARHAMEAVDHELRESEQARANIEQDLQSVREVLEKARIEAQTFHVQRQNAEQKLTEEEYELEQVLEALDPSLTVDAIGEELERIANRVSRLGPINLAAIDEYKVEQERKTYLDAQNEDLQQALETLQEAIRKIDNETRNRFKETFEQVNSGLQELFPKVFGGGSAYLELTGDDLLDTGIAIMARPPGKRNSTIHLLSGGEKALTAIALVFSIFRLNPAPFCMLDEVDAPLDDVNVGRYAQLVADMADSVQFIFITHNKIPMEIAHQLMGVTMHEPGVSRLVTVDVDEAAELASA
ncbi:chromosome segregation protein SMC [Gilvimarinus sp. F26214L]|uniref:chromosome segregation protein SMC n=1 Tax=Gilvimarinus sp. DZF01 TaxID=3461371 RepID=UPI004045B291